MSSLYRVAYRFNRGSVEEVNTFHVVTADAALSIFDAGIDDVRDALHAAFTTKYKAMLSPACTVQDLTVTEVVTPGSGAVPRQSVQTIGAAGTRASAGSVAQHPALSCVVKLKTNAAVRGGIGRMWIPLAGENDMGTDGIVSTGGTLWTAMGTFFDEFLNGHAAGGWTGSQTAHQVVYSRTRHQRGLSPYWFKVKAYTRSPRQHWLRSRSTSP